jgi:hypothetical protein
MGAKYKSAAVALNTQMVIRKLFVTWAAVWVASAACAQPEETVRAAVTALSRSSYQWETTARQRFQGETTEPRLDANARVEVKGSMDPRGYLEITLLPSRDVPVPITAVFREGDVVAQTPSGWLRRNELRQVPGGDPLTDIGGKKVRVSRLLSTAVKVTAMRPHAEELLDLIGEIKAYREVDGGLILAELRERKIEELWADAQAKRAPEIHGTIIFKIGEDGLSEYHVVIAIGFPNSRTKKIAWSMQQWSTRFSGIGMTTVEPATAAVDALEKSP